MIWNRIQYPEAKMLKDNVRRTALAVAVIGSVGTAIQYIALHLITNV